jgi:hypothetical protein
MGHPQSWEELMGLGSGIGDCAGEIQGFFASLRMTVPMSFRMTVLKGVQNDGDETGYREFKDVRRTLTLQVCALRSGLLDGVRIRL